MVLDNILRYLRYRIVLSKIPSNSIVCDIGCGKNAYFFKKISGLINYGFGFDKDIEFYKDSKIELRKINFETEKLPLSQEIVDIVTMMAVLEHLDNCQNVLQEIYRILKPGGRLILTTPSPAAKFILEFLAFKLKLISRRDIKEHKKYLSPQEIKNLLSKSGFQPEKIKTSYFEGGLNILAVAEK